MKVTILLFALLWSGIAPLKAEETSRETSLDSITVYIFLHEACVISQYYTKPLGELYEEYETAGINFIGLFPNLASTPQKIQGFREKYSIPFALKADYYHDKKEAFGATVTPEVVVYNESRGEIIYQGRIDDAYARVGKKKLVTRTAELREVLEAIANNEAVCVENTPAVGCFIGKEKLK